MKSRNIVPSLAPTIFGRDVALALALLARPRAWRTGSERERLEDELGERLDGLRVSALDSGRNALRLALQTLGIGRGDEVLLQAYTCVSVPGPVMWVGARPVYVDIRAETFTMDSEDLKRKISPRSRALILQHTFGLPADIEPLLAIARQHGLKVIEDCAHALGATYHGQPVGTFGDVAIFSFGRDKVISSVFGGALVMKSASGHLRGLEPPSALWVLQQILHPLAMSIIRPTYFNGGRYALVALQILKMLSKAISPREKRGGEPPLTPSLLPNALAALARSQLTRLDDFVHHRQMLAQHFTESLQNLPGVVLPQTPPDRTHGFLRYTIRVPRPEVLHAEARRAGIILGDWYDTVVAPKDADLPSVGYRRGACPRAEEAARQSVNLPTSPILALPDANHVLRTVRAILEREHR